MKNLTTALLIVLSYVMVSGQQHRIPVWPDGPPNSNGITVPEEQFDGVRIRNVSVPEMFVYLPEASLNTGAAVVICPGGGYQVLAMDHEGHDMARWLADNGIAGIVLKYRLPNGHHEIPATDARQAIRTVRANAAEWGIDIHKVGVAGSSAGGHLAATVGTRFDSGNFDSEEGPGAMSSRPDFLLLLYPVISLKEEWVHAGSRRSLLGDGNLNYELVAFYSNELHATAETPPTFLVLADNDGTVVPHHSVMFYMALKSHGVPAEMHIFQEGGHGFGMRKNSLPSDDWPNLFLQWMIARKIVESP